jgi:High potential iron-sulfur protein
MLDHELQRRRLLRGMLAAGCVMSLPMVTGCNAKPSATGATENSAASSGASGTQGNASPDGTSQVSQSAAAKISQAQAKYQGQPKGDQMCANCTNFITPNSCKVVEGKVSHDGWCTLWVRKQA